jgi:DNA-binding response OmpR family regulator
VTAPSHERAPILVADDDPHIVELVSLFLRRAGYEVETAADGDEALRKALSCAPALAILDVMMPGQDGLQVCRTLRARGDLPIVLLTARSSDIDTIAGLKLGADDYVTKPFNPDELVARVQAVLRRARPAGTAPIEQVTVGDLTVDPGARVALLRGRPLTLTPREFDLLTTLARFRDTVLDREHLLDLVWGTGFYAHRTVDVHVARVRDKLRGGDVRIETVWGTGYRMVAGGGEGP